MAGPSDQQPSDNGTIAVPDLIEQYRRRREAWIAQADELARLRDEVRGSAEREAMEIVTTARREVRKVITEARRELLVLSAQVQAALGETTTKTDPATLLHKAGFSGDDNARRVLSAASAAPEFAPEGAVEEILSEVQADMTALDEDARTLPLRVVPPVAPPAAASPALATPSLVVAAAVPPPPMASPSVDPLLRPAFVSESRPSAPRSVESPRPFDPPRVIDPPRILEPPRDSNPALSESASRALLSSQFPSEAVPVPSSGGFKTFVGLFVGIGLVVALGTVYWLQNRGQAAASSSTPVAENGSSPSAEPTAAAPEAPAVAASPEPTPSARPAASGNLSLVAEAVRDVWVRTTIDGQSDEGRTLTTGQVIDVSADQSISLRVGDAGAIVVSVNRGAKVPLGRDGQVVTRQFLADGASRAPRPAVPPATPRPDPPAATPEGPPTVSAPSAPPQAASSSPVQSLAPQANPPAQSGVVSPAPPRVANATPASAPAAPVQPAATPPIVSPRPETAAPPAQPQSPATAVVAAARQWLDAYHRQDRAAMAALSVDNLLLADERRTEERFPPGQNDVTRSLDRVSVQIAADTAVLTAVMTEQSGSVPGPRVSPVSQVWVLAGGGQWKVRQARFVSEARLNQVFTR
jgi:hypothetical protein